MNFVSSLSISNSSNIWSSVFDLKSLKRLFLKDSFKKRQSTSVDLHPLLLKSKIKGTCMSNVNQSTFIQNLVTTNSKVNVYLISGIKLIGCIKAFDDYSIQLDNDTSSQLVFKQAISTIVAV